jgi:hypothetical protein
VTDGTGWPGIRQWMHKQTDPIEGEAYNQHANVKLTAEQKAVIEASGEPESQWIREAIQMRIDQERKN